MLSKVNTPNKMCNKSVFSQLIGWPFGQTLAKKLICVEKVLIYKSRCVKDMHNVKQPHMKLVMLKVETGVDDQVFV